MQEMKRPTGLTVISILWLLGSLVNLFLGMRVINNDLEAMALLSRASVHEWFRFGVPAEMALAGIFVVIFAFIQMTTVYGLLSRKVWSYKLALTVPVLLLIDSIATVALYMSAPPSLIQISSVNYVGIGAGIFWLVVIWSYLRQQHVKQYLRQNPPPASASTQAPCSRLEGGV